MVWRSTTTITVSIVMVFWIGTGLVGVSRAVPTTEKECVVHPLPAEVVEQLLTAANASLTDLQDKKLQGRERQYPDISTHRELSNLGASPDLLLLLLHTMEREQARHDQEISKLMQVVNVGRHVMEGSSSTTNHGSSSESLSEAVLELQRDVRRLQAQEPVLANTVSRTDSVENLHLSTQTPNSIATKHISCYPTDTWPHDCHDLAQQGKNESGVYIIYPYRCRRSERGVRGWCDFEGDDNDDNWSVVLSRRPLEEQVNFNRGWREYRAGFGDPETEHWIGNDVLHELTSDRPQVLRVEMADWDGNQRYAEYQTFLVEDEDAQYRLHLGQYSGNAGTGFDEHDNMRFSTTDRNNDMRNSSSCAVSYKGGFWYNKCHAVSPTSLLLEKQKSTIGITWNSWYQDRTTLKEISFKLKPKPCYIY